MGGLRPVYTPLVQDAKHEVPKDRLEEDHLRDKIGVNIDNLAKTKVIGNLKAEREGHLME